MCLTSSYHDQDTHGEYPDILNELLAEFRTIFDRRQFRHFQRADIDMSGLKWFNSVGQGQVLKPLNEALGLLNHMQDQIEAIKRREK